MKNTVEGINKRLDETEDWIRDLEGKVEDITQLKSQKEKELKKIRIF